MVDNLNNQPTLKCLIDLGMSEREARVYFALLKKRRATASELQKLSGLPQNKIYDTLNKLTRDGHFLEKKEGRLRIFEIRDPKESLAFAFEEFKKRQKNIEEQKQEIEKLFRNGTPYVEPLEYIEVLYGNDNVHRKYVSLLRSVKKEILGFNRAPYACFTEEMVAEQEREGDLFLNRGGKSRAVIEISEKSPEWLFTSLEKESTPGEEIRISDSLPLKMAIFDRETLLLADEGGLASGGELTMSAIKQEITVNGYVALFEFFWNHAIEYEEWKKRNLQRQTI
jgi:sugar-specific transcriptional regulator TrmB